MASDYGKSAPGKASASFRSLVAAKPLRFKNKPQTHVPSHERGWACLLLLYNLRVVFIPDGLFFPDPESFNFHGYQYKLCKEIVRFQSDSAENKRITRTMNCNGPTNFREKKM